MVLAFLKSAENFEHRGHTSAARCTSTALTIGPAVAIFARSGLHGARVIVHQKWPRVEEYTPSPAHVWGRGDEGWEGGAPLQIVWGAVRTGGQEGFRPPLQRVCVCMGHGGSTVFTRSSRLDLYGHTGVLGSGRSPL